MRPGTVGPDPFDSMSAPAPALPALDVPEKVRAGLSAASLETLAAPDSALVYSLDPDIWMDAGREHGGIGIQKHALQWMNEKTGTFGHAPFTGVHRPVVQGLYNGIRDATYSAECYSPRHALRFQKGEHVVVVILCFECIAIAILEPTTTEWNVAPMLDRGHAVRNQLNALLDGAKVKRDQPPPEEEPDDFDDDWDDDEDDDE